MELKHTPIYNQPLAEILFQQQMTYRHLAVLLDVAPNSVRNFLYGKHTPSFSFMLRMCLTLQLTSEDMMAIFFNVKGSLPHIKSFEETLKKKEQIAGQEKKEDRHGS